VDSERTHVNDEHDCEGLSEDEAKQATEWFASLKPGVWEKVVETDTVPKSNVSDGHRRYVRPGGTEPIGHRIIEVPRTFEVTSRDPHCGFIVYVPLAASPEARSWLRLEFGEDICLCNLPWAIVTGLGDSSDIAGHSPTYIVANSMASRRAPHEWHG